MDEKEKENLYNNLMARIKKKKSESLSNNLTATTEEIANLLHLRINQLLQVLLVAENRELTIEKMIPQLYKNNIEFALTEYNLYSDEQLSAIVCQAFINVYELLVNLSKNEQSK